MEYEIVKALHIISVICWMAGMLYLPRLFVYHAQAIAGGEADKTFAIMEMKLLRYIMNPAMIATYVFGIWLVIIMYQSPANAGGWLHAKIALVLGLSACHGMMAAQRKRFARRDNTKSPRYYKWFNEIPTLMMVVIVFLVVLKPF